MSQRTQVGWDRCSSKQQQKTKKHGSLTGGLEQRACNHQNKGKWGQIVKKLGIRCQRAECCSSVFPFSSAESPVEPTAGVECVEVETWWVVQTCGRRDQREREREKAKKGDGSGADHVRKKQSVRIKSVASQHRNKCRQAKAPNNVVTLLERVGRCEQNSAANAR